MNISNSKEIVLHDHEFHNSIYCPCLQAIIESEECLERVACDVGGLASEAGLDTSLANLGSMMVSNKYSKLMKSFAKAKDCHKIKCGNLF